MVGYTCNPSTWEVKAGRSQVLYQPGLHCDFKASPGYIVSLEGRKKGKEGRK
jgi:hypothetical protein